MKKTACFIWAVLLAVSLLLTACQGSADPSGTADSSVQSEGAQSSAAEEEKIDVDLTRLSSTMVYSEVYNMMATPEEYVGKIIKMSGRYYSYEYEGLNTRYHYVVVADAAACCQQGLEFVWRGDHAYPGDYPEDQSQVEIVGEFQAYEELGQTYYHVVVDDILRK